jgi:hypothetical protein
LKAVGSKSFRLVKVSGRKGEEKVFCAFTQVVRLIS